MDGSSLVLLPDLTDVVTRLMVEGVPFDTIRHSVQCWITTYGQFPCRTYIEQGKVVVAYSGICSEMPVRISVPILQSYETQAQLVSDGW